ncbi:hypothetical protein HPB50_001085 [Hyalomma asiaticum]|uniref:Uncharacterized protein n=1 Tax=Hyalomma asiaticum TaxID=266040 RepID=A0ACB7RLB6_HYAAI|nr:hypothetical protein HPB50_001085 [Hyalomma asiaticum]
MPEQQRSVTSWRATHVVAYLFAMGTSIGALVCYRNMNARLHTTVDKCLLFTKPWIDVDASTGKCQIDYTRIEWSSDKLCNYVTFALLASFVYSIVAVWFFVMCAPSRGSQLHDSIVHVWKIVAPASMLSGVMALITLVMAWKVTNGMNIFFHDLNMGMQRNCTTTNMIGWKDNTVALLLADRVPTKILVWLVFLCWMFATLALVVRCATAADFTEDKREWLVDARLVTFFRNLFRHCASGSTARIQLDTLPPASRFLWRQCNHSPMCHLLPSFQLVLSLWAHLRVVPQSVLSVAMLRAGCDFILYC